MKTDIQSGIADADYSLKRREKLICSMENSIQEEAL
jgi:hypothetical protein